MKTEHKAKISASLKRYATTERSHLPRIHGSGQNHPNWRGGVSPSYYREVARAEHGDLCQRCGAPATLVHHKDENRRNNLPDNLQPLCKKCHMIVHRGKRVDWTFACGTTLSLGPSAAAKRKYCSMSCKMSRRGENGRFN